MSETPAKKTASAASKPADPKNDAKDETPKGSTSEATKDNTKDEPKKGDQSDDVTEGEDNKEGKDATVFDAPGVQKPGSVKAREGKNGRKVVSELRRQDISQIYTN